MKEDGASRAHRSAAALTEHLVVVPPGMGGWEGSTGAWLQLPALQAGGLPSAQCLLARGAERRPQAHPGWGCAWAAAS